MRSPTRSFRDTKTPGAKAAKVGPFMAVMVTDCYDAKEQKIFRDGMKQLDDACRKANNVVVHAGDAAAALVASRSARQGAEDVHGCRRGRAQEKASDTTTTTGGEEGRGASRAISARKAGSAATSAPRPRSPPTRRPHYFRMMKELTLLGYFTSEIGCTQAQRYAETPGKYDPCVPYKPGDKAWAPHA